MYKCGLLIAFANSLGLIGSPDLSPDLDPDQARQNVRPDLDPNYLTH